MLVFLRKHPDRSKASLIIYPFLTGTRVIWTSSSPGLERNISIPRQGRVISTRIANGTQFQNANLVLEILSTPDYTAARQMSGSEIGSMPTSPLTGLLTNKISHISCAHYILLLRKSTGEELLFSRCT